MRSASTCHPDRDLWANGLCAACHQRAYRAANRERINSLRRARGREKTLAEGKAPKNSPGQGLNPGRRAAAVRAYAARNRDAIRAANNAWYAAHPEVKKAKRHKRRARLRDGRSPGVSPADWRAIVDLFGGCCAYCLEKTPHPERDHVEPLSRGGLDALDNVVPSCHRCNARKAARTLLAFLPLHDKAAA